MSETKTQPRQPEWEFVCRETDDSRIVITDCLDVPNGWVYRVRTWHKITRDLISTCICHVPE